MNAGRLNVIDQTFIALITGGARAEGKSEGERGGHYVARAAEDYRLSTIFAAKQADKRTIFLGIFICYIKY